VNIDEHISRLLQFYFIKTDKQLTAMSTHSFKTEITLVV